MRKGYLNALLLLSCGALGGAVLAGCGTHEGDVIQTEDKNIVSISVVEGSVPDYIFVGRLDEAGIQLEIRYSDGSSEILDVTTSFISPQYRPLLQREGDVKVEILYRGQTTVLNLHIVAEYHTVTFNAYVSTNTYQKVGTYNVRYLESATAPEVTQDFIYEGHHYYFKGWDKTFSHVTKNITVYALYDSPECFSVTFYDGNEEVISTQMVDWGQDAIAPSESERAMEGYDFVGWDRSYYHVTQPLSIYGIYVRVTDYSQGDPTYGPPGSLANGAYNYQYASGEERTKILGKLEKYAIENKLTGLTLFGNGGYVMHNPGVQKGSNVHIPGYGFGELAEGNITADLDGETNADWARYWHTYEIEDPAKINAMDDKGSVVEDLAKYVNAAYFDTQMNETKDGYEWVGDLSPQNRPIPVDANENGLTDTYRVEVKVGSALKYSTTSTKYAAYNNREVALEDYVTPYKIYYTQAYGMARGSENLADASSLAGTKAYYDGSKNGFSEELWKNVGIKAMVDNQTGKSYLEFTFSNPTTRFYAMDYLSKNMFAPVPAEFISEIGGGDFAAGVKNWGVPSSGETILDHWLCTGPYMLERWDEGQQIVFKKNPNYADRGRYKIGGVHVNVLTAMKDDPEADLNEFLAGKLHTCGIPSTKLDEYKNDPRTSMTSDSSAFKLNLNTCTQDVWESLFGENGSVWQTPAVNYWECEPAMANKDFVDGLSFAIDRKSYASMLGRTPSMNFFGSAYMSDPEGGVAYNNTQEHKDAIANLQDGTDGYGYSLERAKASFKKAAEQLIADGYYKEGDTVEIEIAWQEPSDEQIYHAPLAKMLTDAFNTDENPLTLRPKFWVGKTWQDVYTEKCMTGQFDIGFGTIAGNTLNPLNFLENLKSDNSGGFTLNWGLDTNATDDDHLIEYDGKSWSFDALWTCADHGGYVENGANAPLFDFDENIEVVGNSEGGIDVTIKTRDVFVADKAGTGYDAFGQFYGLVIYGQTGDAYEESAIFMRTDERTHVINDAYWTTEYTVTFDAQTAAHYNAFTDKLGIDVYYAAGMFNKAPTAVYAGSVALQPGSLPIPN